MGADLYFFFFFSLHSFMNCIIVHVPIRSFAITASGLPPTSTLGLGVWRSFKDISQYQ